MLAKFISFISFVAAIILLFFVVSTTPAAVGPLGILTVFICMYIVTLGVLTFLFWSLHRGFIRLVKPFTVRRPIEPISLSRSYYFSSIIALAPIMLIAMQSVGSVNVYDVGLVGLFVFIGCVYIARRTA